MGGRWIQGAACTEASRTRGFWPRKRREASRGSPGSFAPQQDDNRRRMLESTVVKPSIRLLAADIDGTLLNPQFQISDADMTALRRAQDEGVEIVLVTGRRHMFALPIAQQLGFDLWIISSNGAVTRSLAGETFHRDLLPAEACRRLCGEMREFRGNTVLTFDVDGKGAIVLEHMQDLTASIQRWLEKNLEYIDFVIPIEDSLTMDPVQAMFCGTIVRMHQVLEGLEASSVEGQITVSRTEYPVRDLSIVDVLNRGCTKGHALERWANFRGIPREQVMAIGDNYNDVEMLSYAGSPFIMGNASEELLGKGWAVTRSNAESGVAAAIEQVMGWSRVQV
jgi:Cof subfamily protein (haloacid dehalogenase superfamily)